jgi:hypothetical protein
MAKKSFYRITVQAVVFFVTSVLFLLIAAENAQWPKIVESEARSLAFEGLKTYIRRDNLENVFLTRIQDKYDLDFYYFDANWLNPVGSPHLAYIAVNPWNGEVWNAAICKRLDSPSLAKMQQSIRKRFRLSKNADAVYRSKEPLCNNR